MFKVGFTSYYIYIYIPTYLYLFSTMNLNDTSEVVWTVPRDFILVLIAI